MGTWYSTVVIGTFIYISVFHRCSGDLYVHFGIPPLPWGLVYMNFGIPFLLFELVYKSNFTQNYQGKVH